MVAPPHGSVIRQHLRLLRWPADSCGQRRHAILTRRLVKAPHLKMILESWSLLLEIPTLAIAPRSYGGVPAQCGQTLEEFAAAAGISRFSGRGPYRDFLLRAPLTALPAITRMEQSAGGIKFCLEAGRPQAAALETESVIVAMQGFHGHRWHTLCLSSQVGCRMGCTFCQTARMGLQRNLTAAEIVVQLMVARAILRGSDPMSQRSEASGADVRNLVFMGMGEPLDNFDAVVQAIRVFTDPNGFNMPLSRITVSTVGRIDGLKKLSALNWPHLRLAISLNAADDDLRSRLMPVNKAMPLAELRQALLEYPLPRRGRFLIEYVLIKDVNDSPQDALKIAQWCKPLPVTVNVIGYNPQQPATFATPGEEEQIAFVRQLRNWGVFAKRRVTHARDLMGACGQLGNVNLRRAAGSPA